MTSGFAALAPGPGEAAVLSLLAVRTDDGWSTVCGSLLTVPAEQAFMSWPQWGRLQPTARPRHRATFGDPLDVGPNFRIQPFDGLMGARQIVTIDEWQSTLEALLSGKVKCGTVHCSFDASSWSTSGLLGARTGGQSDLHAVVHGARRPVTGLATTLTAPSVPHSEAVWELEVPGGVPRGRDLARMSAARQVLHWPMELLGIYWLGTDEFEPPARFVVGRTAGDAWITGIDPDYEDAQLHPGNANRA